MEDAQEPVASGRPPWAAGIGDPLRFFVNQDLGVPSRIGQPSETSVASAGPVVVYTGNDDAEFSLDGGLTFRRLDPVSIDDDGVQDDGGFCCDQVIHYAPQINRFIWLIQFDCKPVERPAACATGADRENRYRLAIASPERISASAADPPSAWDYWDITPAQFKQNGKWFDYPDLAVPDPRFGGNSLYMTWNVFGPNPGDNGAMFARVNLRDLAKGRFNYQYIFDSSRINTSPAQSTRGRAFISGHKDAGALRILYADDASMLAFDRVVPHPTIPTESWESFVAGGGNWFSRSRLWAVGGSVARLGELWVAWGAARDWCIANCDREDPKDRITKRGYDQPHIEIAVLDSSTFTLKREIVLHNSAFAFTYPALDVNSEGDVGIAYSYGGGAKSPSPGVGILTGHPELFRTSAGSPTGGQGDYNTIHRHYPDGTRFSAAGFAKKSDGYDHWQYTQFGRGPLPPKGPTGSPPDLVVSSLTKGSFTVTNSGGAAAGAFVVRLTGAPPDATFAYPGLSPGESATQDFFCRGVTRTATVDADSQVVESREDNNQATVSYPGCIS